MADNKEEMIIVRDGDGRFYAFTPEQWTEARVPEDVQAALAEMFDGDDTQGLMAGTQPGQHLNMWQFFTSVLSSFQTTQKGVIQQIGQ